MCIGPDHGIINSFMNDKSRLRKHYLDLLQKQDRKEGFRKSRLIEEEFFRLPAIVKAKTILFYASLPGEVDTFAMIRKAMDLKKQVALPVVLREQRTLIPTLTENMKDLRLSTYGIHAPHRHKDREIPLERLDAVVVPALAFDKANNRLGRGKGYYDRFLKSLSCAVTVGIAFDFQIAESLPFEDHDVGVHHVIAG